MILTVFCTTLLIITFNEVGYVPLFSGQTHVTKYFQEDLAIFVTYRPIYMFAINTLSVLLTFSLVMLAQVKRRTDWMFIAGLCIIVLLMTAKRGPILLPLLYIGFGVISYMYGLVVGYVDNWFLRSKWIANHGLISIAMGITILQMGILAFYENGSSAILFL